MQCLRTGNLADEELACLELVLCTGYSSQLSCVQWFMEAGVG